MNEQIRSTKQRVELLNKSVGKSKEFAGLGKRMKNLEAKKAERLATV